MDRLRVLSPRRWVAAWLLLALSMAPLLGRMHQVLHVPVLVAAQQAVWTAAGGAEAVQLANAGPGSSTRHPQVLALFAHHVALDCQTLDQLGHADTAVWVGIPPLPVWEEVAAANSGAPCRFLVAPLYFDARAPPVRLGPDRA